MNEPSEEGPLCIDFGGKYIKASVMNDKVVDLLTVQASRAIPNSVALSDDNGFIIGDLALSETSKLNADRVLINISEELHSKKKDSNIVWKWRGKEYKIRLSVLVAEIIKAYVMCSPIKVNAIYYVIPHDTKEMQQCLYNAVQIYNDKLPVHFVDKHVSILYDFIYRRAPGPEEKALFIDVGYFQTEIFLCDSNTRSVIKYSKIPTGSRKITELYCNWLSEKYPLIEKGLKTNSKISIIDKIEKAYRTFSESNVSILNIMNIVPQEDFKEVLERCDFNDVIQPVVDEIANELKKIYNEKQKYSLIQILGSGGRAYSINEAVKNIIEMNYPMPLNNEECSVEGAAYYAHECNSDPPFTFDKKITYISTINELKKRREYVNNEIEAENRVMEEKGEVLKFRNFNRAILKKHPSLSELAKKIKEVTGVDDEDEDYSLSYWTKMREWATNAKQRIMDGETASEVLKGMPAKGDKDDEEVKVEAIDPSSDFPDEEEYHGNDGYGSSMISNLVYKVIKTCFPCFPCTCESSDLLDTEGNFNKSF